MTLHLYIKFIHKASLQNHDVHSRNKRWLHIIMMWKYPELFVRYRKETQDADWVHFSQRLRNCFEPQSTVFTKKKMFASWFNFSSSFANAEKKHLYDVWKKKKQERSRWANMGQIHFTRRPAFVLKHRLRAVRAGLRIHYTLFLRPSRALKLHVVSLMRLAHDETKRSTSSAIRSINLRGYTESDREVSAECLIRLIGPREYSIHVLFMLFFFHEIYDWCGYSSKNWLLRRSKNYYWPIHAKVRK